MEFRDIGFWGEEKTEVPRGKPLTDKSENQQQNQPKYDVIHWDPNTKHIRECFHRCATLLLSKVNDPYLVFSLKVLSEFV